jgi:hypothetical protein
MLASRLHLVLRSRQCECWAPFPSHTIMNNMVLCLHRSEHAVPNNPSTSVLQIYRVSGQHWDMHTDTVKQKHDCTLGKYLSRNLAWNKEQTSKLVHTKVLFTITYHYHSYLFPLLQLLIKLCLEIEKTEGVCLFTWQNNVVMPCRLIGRYQLVYMESEPRKTLSPRWEHHKKSYNITQNENICAHTSTSRI